MLNIRSPNEDLLADVSAPEREMLLSFLRISTHPASAPRTIEAQILTSLALALRSRQAAV